MADSRSMGHDRPALPSGSDPLKRQQQTASCSDDQDASRDKDGQGRGDREQKPGRDRRQNTSAIIIQLDLLSQRLQRLTISKAQPTCRMLYL